MEGAMEELIQELKVKIVDIPKKKQLLNKFIAK